MVTSFTTSKGSIYNILSEGRTKRWKKVNNEGNQTESDMTLYIGSEHATRIGVHINFGNTWVSFKKDKLTIMVNRKPDTDVPYSKEPSEGLHPLELWGSLTNPDSLHVGNPITKMW